MPKFAVQAILLVPSQARVEPVTLLKLYGKAVLCLALGKLKPNKMECIVHMLLGDIKRRVISWDNTTKMLTKDPLPEMFVTNWMK